jgi:putative addiction module killer protein
VIELVLYTRDDGRCPFDEWLSSLRDKLAQARIFNRMRQLESGNFGDHASVGEGILELRIHVGAGYRVYCGRSGTSIVILLCGGDKSSQSKDIERAKGLWESWKRGSK